MFDYTIEFEIKNDQNNSIIYVFDVLYDTHNKLKPINYNKKVGVHYVYYIRR